MWLFSRELPQYVLGVLNLALRARQATCARCDASAIAAWSSSSATPPSSSRALYAMLHRTLTGKRWAHYYDGWPEKQADRLGGANVSLRRRRSGPR